MLNKTNLNEIYGGNNMREIKLIDKDTMRIMLINHLSSFSVEQIESLLDDLFKEKQFIEFSDFNKICIF